MASTRHEIYDGRGMRIGWIESDERGNKRIYSFAKGLVGFYYRDTNRTVTVSGKIVAYSDCSTALLFS